MKSITMKYFLTLILIVSASFATGSYADSKTVKILPLGDSITCASKYKRSYRYPLWQHLVDAGKQIEFIGSQTHKGNGGRSWKPYRGQRFPAANDGHSGWRADQILKGLPNGEKGLDHWIAGYRPDIALIHLGTNDVYQSQSAESTRDEIEQVIIKLRAKNPNIKVLLAKIVPMRMNNGVPRLNQLLGQLAIKLNQANSPVVSVDMYSGFSIHTDMQKDQIHPNARGEDKMAKRWFDALMLNKFIR
jgi:lysophospholipase L1-like esterase